MFDARIQASTCVIKLIEPVFRDKITLNCQKMLSEITLTSSKMHLNGRSLMENLKILINF